jgi:hypothetical protein
MGVRHPTCFSNSLIWVHGTIRNSRGERPVDTAERRGGSELVPLLTPDLKRDVPSRDLTEMQVHFHQVIRGRVDHLVQEHALRLPELEPLLEMDVPKVWFAVPGMYGGFTTGLSQIDRTTVLVAESWCRVSDGSGQRHIVSPHGSLALEEVFVYESALS